MDDKLRRDAERRFENGITKLQILNLMERSWKAAETHLIENAVVPIIEFFPIDNPSQTTGKKDWHIFSPETDTHLSPLHKILQKSHGIYIFHDSSGRAIYAGKAGRDRLWSEINVAFNRNRGEVQSIKRVNYPTNNAHWKENQKRQIKKTPVVLHEIARYVTAYKVPPRLITKFEALIIRSFANDLLNVRMEKF
jgi:hypothetical protein